MAFEVIPRCNRREDHIFTWTVVLVQKNKACRRTATCLYRLHFWFDLYCATLQALFRHRERKRKIKEIDGALDLLPLSFVNWYFQRTRGCSRQWSSGSQFPWCYAPEELQEMLPLSMNYVPQIQCIPWKWTIDYAHLSSVSYFRLQIASIDVFSSISANQILNYRILKCIEKACQCIWETDVDKEEGLETFIMFQFFNYFTKNLIFI